MFDIGFSEMMVIAVIALVVLGPEKLPRVARTVGHLLGRMQRYVNDVKADINREVELDELRKLQQEMQSTAQSIEQTVKGEFNAVESEFKSINESTQKALSDPVADALADPQPVHAPVVTSPATESPQLELGLDDKLPRPNAPPPPVAQAPLPSATAESASAATKV